MKWGTASKSATVENGASGEGHLMMRSECNTIDAKEEAVAASFEVEKPAVAAIPADAAKADTAGNEERLRLPQKFVDYVLSWKLEVIVGLDEYYARRINDPAFSRGYVERRTKTLRDVAELFKHCADMMVEYKGLGARQV
jgi:hypothetical protein